MSNIIRYYSPERIYFVTAVTHRRVPLLMENVDLLWQAIDRSRRIDQFYLIAWSILPDHMHLLAEPGESSFSDIMHRIKLSFGSRYRKRNGLYRGKVWQDGFWDHMIRDQEDLNRHIDYIHYNPVKHGLTCRPFDWAESSAADFLKRGFYSRDWGQSELLIHNGNYGE